MFMRLWNNSRSIILENQHFVGVAVTLVQKLAHNKKLCKFILFANRFLILFLSSVSILKSVVRQNVKIS